MGRRFQAFANNPLTKSELIFLRRQPEKTWKRVRLWIFMTAMAVSVTPLWLYMDTNQTGTLLLMVVVIYLAHLVVGMRTMLLATHAVTREQRAGTWDTLILTGIDARRIVWGKWWAVVKYVWKDHALMALPRVGLAFGLAQWLHVIPGGNCPESLPFCYRSHDYYLSPSYYISPQLITTIAGGVSIAAFGVIEVGLIVATGLWATLATKQHEIRPIVIGVMTRVFLIILALMIFQLSDDSSYLALKTYCVLSPTCFLTEDGRCFDGNKSDSTELSVASRTVARISDTLKISASSFIESGTLLAANIMRPFGEGSFFGVGWEYLNGEIVIYRSNRLFVLRNFVAAALGLGLYALIITGMLRLAEGAAGRRHGALRVGAA